MLFVTEAIFVLEHSRFHASEAQNALRAMAGFTMTPDLVEMCRFVPVSQVILTFPATVRDFCRGDYRATRHHGMRRCICRGFSCFHPPSSDEVGTSTLQESMREKDLSVSLLLVVFLRFHHVGGMTGCRRRVLFPHFYQPLLLFLPFLLVYEYYHMMRVAKR